MRAREGRWEANIGGRILENLDSNVCDVRLLLKEKRRRGTEGWDACFWVLGLPKRPSTILPTFAAFDERKQGEGTLPLTCHNKNFMVNHCSHRGLKEKPERWLWYQALWCKIPKHAWLSSSPLHLSSWPKTSNTDECSEERWWGTRIEHIRVATWEKRKHTQDKCKSWEHVKCVKLYHRRTRDLDEKWCLKILSWIGQKTWGLKIENASSST